MTRAEQVEKLKSEEIGGDAVLGEVRGGWQVEMPRWRK